MRLLHSPLPPPPPLLTSFSPIKASILPTKSSFNSHHRPLHQALSTGFSFLLSLGLLVSAPVSTIALESPLLQSSNSSLDVNCKEEEEEVYEEKDNQVSQVVSNERIVEEAWQIVNDSFLNTSTRRSWSPESWLKKKDDILSSSIQTRSKAHDIIKRMLASLGDPYTRFLPPEQI